MFQRPAETLHRLSCFWHYTRPYGLLVCPRYRVFGRIARGQIPSVPLESLNEGTIDPCRFGPVARTIS